MDVDQIARLLDLAKDHELTEFEVEQDGLRLRIRRDSAFRAAESPVLARAAAPVVTAAGPALVPGLPADAETDVELAIVKSPIVGTFFRSAEPSAAAFVEVGSMVKKGQVLCIIEAMKLMNEIDSEYDGEIVNVYIENGQPVQYGERLFAIKTR